MTEKMENKKQVTKKQPEKPVVSKEETKEEKVLPKKDPMEFISMNNVEHDVQKGDFIKFSIGSDISKLHWGIVTDFGGDKMVVRMEDGELFDMTSIRISNYCPGDLMQIQMSPLKLVR